jgi:hypothetical protein
MSFGPQFNDLMEKKYNILQQQADAESTKANAAAQVGLSGKTVDAAAGPRDPFLDWWEKTVCGRRWRMAIADACQLWIKKRIEEELQDIKTTGKLFFA